jgi:hypothetical protein
MLRSGIDKSFRFGKDGGSMVMGEGEGFGMTGGVSVRTTIESSIL